MAELENRGAGFPPCCFTPLIRNDEKTPRHD